MTTDEKREYLKTHGWVRRDRTTGKADNQEHTEYWQSPYTDQAGYANFVRLDAAVKIQENHQETEDYQQATPTTSINIIDIDLSSDIDSIINSDITTITNQNRSDIEAAINEQKQITEIVVKRDQAKADISTSVEAAFEAIKQADENGQTISAVDLIAITSPHITNLNSLVQRLKAYIKAKELPCQLASIRQGKHNYYYLDSDG